MNKAWRVSLLGVLFLLTMIACANQTTEKKMSSENMSFSKTKIIAHRGFSGIAPENTLAAFKKAIDVKADYFELDVHETKDGQLVVIHDHDLTRTTSNNSVGEVDQMTLSELTSVKVGYPEKFGESYKDEKIPTLKEALQVAKGKIKVCIEIKVLGVEERVMDLVNELKMNDDVIIFSFHYPVLAKIRQLDQNIPILYLIDKADKMTVEYANIIHANAIGVGYATNPTKEYIEFAHSHGVEVWKWTINKEGQMKEMVAIGLDGMITNHPDKAIVIRASRD